MKVKEVIGKLSNETYENEKEYELEIVDREGNKFKIAYYDWCNTTLVVEKV